MATTLTVITGPMFSGKSEEMVRQLKTAAYADKRILLVKPRVDKRNTRNIFTLVRKDDKLAKYQHILTQVVTSIGKLREAINNFAPEILAIDEGQFFKNDLAVFIDKLLHKNRDTDLLILVSGLDMDAWRAEYRVMSKLMAMANNVHKQTAVCLECKGQRGPAIFTQKKGGSSKRVEIGDSKIYGAACRYCHTIPS